MLCNCLPPDVLCSELHGLVTVSLYFVTLKYFNWMYLWLLLCWWTEKTKCSSIPLAVYIFFLSLRCGPILRFRNWLRPWPRRWSPFVLLLGQLTQLLMLLVVSPTPFLVVVQPLLPQTTSRSGLLHCSLHHYQSELPMHHHPSSRVWNTWRAVKQPTKQSCAPLLPLALESYPAGSILTHLCVVLSTVHAFYSNTTFRRIFFCCQNFIGYRNTNFVSAFMKRTFSFLVKIPQHSYVSQYSFLILLVQSPFVVCVEELEILLLLDFIALKQDLHSSVTSFLATISFVFLALINIFDALLFCSRLTKISPMSIFEVARRVVSSACHRLLIIWALLLVKCTSLARSFPM